MPALRPSTANSLSSRALDPFTSSAASRDAGADVFDATAASLSSLPSWPAKVTPSTDIHRPAVWPPSPLQLQSPTQTPALDVTASASRLMSDHVPCTVGRVDPRTRARHPGGPLHGGRGPLIQQAFEHHGAVAQAPFDRGFLPPKDMLPAPDVMAERESQIEEHARHAEALKFAARDAVAVRARGGRQTKEQAAAEAALAEFDAREKERLAKRGKPKPINKLFVHVRDRVLPIAVGAGTQCVYWLATSAVQRYLHLPGAYYAPFSSELTALRVLAKISVQAAAEASVAQGGGVASTTHGASSGSLALSAGGMASPARSMAVGRSMEFTASHLGVEEDFEQDDGDYYAYLKNEQRLSETGLREGDHVWIDVGDGDMPSREGTRTIKRHAAGLDQNERPGAPPLGFEKTMSREGPNPEAITGEEVLLTGSDRKPDAAPTITYYQVRRAPAMITLEEWCERQQKRRDGESVPPINPGKPPEPYEHHEMNYDDFHSCFEQITLSDLNGHKMWSQDVQAILWRYFDLITYIMYYHGAGRGRNAEVPGEPKPLPAISLMELRVFVRRAALTSPYLNLTQIELMLPSTDGTRRMSHAAIHDPEGVVSLPELMEGLVRFSLYRQASHAQPAKPLPDALVAMIEEHIQPAYALPPKVDPDASGFSAALLDESAKFSPTAVGEYLLHPLPELSGAVGRVLRVEARTCRRLFATYATRDETHQTIDVFEWVKMCVNARLLDAAPTDLAAEQRSRTTLTRAELVRLFGAVVVGGEAEEAIDKWAAKFALEEPKADGGGVAAAAGGSSGSIANMSNNKAVAGALLLCELEELIARLALRKFDHDLVTSDAMKVHEVCQLLKASLARTGKGRRPRQPPGYGSHLEEAGLQAVTLGQRTADGFFTQVTEVYEPRLVLTTSQQQHEAAANAERKKAVDMLINKGKYEAMASAKDAKDAKGGKKDGGKKKKSAAAHRTEPDRNRPLEPETLPRAPSRSAAAACRRLLSEGSRFGLRCSR